MPPVELEDPPPRVGVGVGRRVCVVCDMALVLAKVLATPLVLCLGSVVCSVVLLFLCLATCVSRLVLVFFPGPSALPFCPWFLSFAPPIGAGRGAFEGADALTLTR